MDAPETRGVGELKWLKIVHEEARSRYECRVYRRAIGYDSELGTIQIVEDVTPPYACFFPKVDTALTVLDIKELGYLLQCDVEELRRLESKTLTVLA